MVSFFYHLLFSGNFWCERKYMLNNYLVTALRNILRHKGFSISNIAELAITMTVCIIILLSSFYELIYDRHLPNCDRIYRVNTEFHLSAETEEDW